MYKYAFSKKTPCILWRWTTSENSDFKFLALADPEILGGLPSFRSRASGFTEMFISAKLNNTLSVVYVFIRKLWMVWRM